MIKQNHKVGDKNHNEQCCLKTFFWNVAELRKKDFGFKDYVNSFDVCLDETWVEEKKEI